MPTQCVVIDDSDEFDVDSLSETDLLTAAVEVESSQGQLKRKNHPTPENSPAKRVAPNRIKDDIVYPTQCELATASLNAVFGMETFRQGQEAAIARILAGGSAVVVFPTGSGKSLCFQLPAIVFAEQDKLENTRGNADGGITLVVSPLIALMKDQCDRLVSRGVRAAVMDSTKTREQYLETSDALKAGTLKILYCAPERLNNEGFIEQMKGVRGGIRLVAVDEAHCISEWGHAFRPDYLKVSRFVNESKAERVVCLTATATPRVAQDICNAFDISPSGLFRNSSYRSNLHLLAESGLTKMELYPKLFKFLREHPGPTIIYVTLQKQTELLADDLRKQGFNTMPFHAGMQAAEKNRVQDDFMKRQDLIIVATIAFGMGIDKFEIRSVIHFNIPSSIESYSQEIGRAGRDGKVSICMFYVCGEDVHLREIFARGDLPSRESVKNLLEEIFSPENTTLRVNQSFQASLFEQTKKHDIRATALNNIYAQLELRFGLIRATTPIYSKYSYSLGSAYHAIVSSDNSPAAAAIKQFVEKAKTLHHIDVSAAAGKSGVPRSDIIRKLNVWNESQAIELRTAGVINVYRVLKQLPSTKAEVKTIVDGLYAEMEKRELRDLKRTDEVLELITGRACFAKKLAEHFGDSLPGGKAECGHCSWCLTHQPIPLKVPPPIEFNKAAFGRILNAVQARDDARFLARVAFGISSPRSSEMKLGWANPLFGSMGDHSFMQLLHKFTSVCSGVAQGTLRDPAVATQRGTCILDAAARGHMNYPARSTASRGRSGGNRGSGSRGSRGGTRLW